MSFADVLLPEFDHEMRTTRTMLERTPEADAAWQPHQKSMALGHLAMHLATLPRWAPRIFRGTEFDLSGADGESHGVPPFESTTALLRTFDESVAAARAAIAGAPDAAFGEPWTLRSGGHVVFTIPRAASLRSFVLSHMIHHRGQYSVYLRLRNVPLPSVYGPTADTGI